MYLCHNINNLNIPNSNKHFRPEQSNFMSASDENPERKEQTKRDVGSSTAANLCLNSAFMFCEQLAVLQMRLSFGFNV